MSKAAISLPPTYTSTLLPDESPCIYQASLVRRLGGMHEAAVIQQIHYLLGLPNSGRDYDGHHWIWKSAEELGCEIGLTESQTRRVLKDLCSPSPSRMPRIDERGIRRGIPESTLLIAIHNPFKGWDQTFWYRINYDHKYLQMTIPPDASYDPVTWSSDSPTCKSRKHQIDPSDSSDASDDPGGAIPENTTREDRQESTQHTPAKTTQQDRAQDSFVDVLGRKGKIRRLKRPDQPSAKEAAAPTADHDSSTAETALERMEARKKQGPQDRHAALRERAERKREAA